MEGQAGDEQAPVSGVRSWEGRADEEPAFVPLKAAGPETGNSDDI
jgi:hypothetical protein